MNPSTLLARWNGISGGCCGTRRGGRTNCWEGFGSHPAFPRAVFSHSRSSFAVMTGAGQRGRGPTPHCWSIPVPRQGTSGIGGTLSPSSDGCAVPGTAADPWVWLRCHGKKLSLTPAFASLLQTLARQREGGRDGNPSQPLVLLKLKVREPRELKGVRSGQAVTTPEFRMVVEKTLRVEGDEEQAGCHLLILVWS